jgi:hypothetical protein
MKLSKTEKALYVELVAQIAILMPGFSPDGVARQHNQHRKDRRDIKSCVVEHGFLSDFELACEVLHQLGALSPLNADDTLSPKDDATAWSGYFRMKFDVPELRAHLAGTLLLSALPLSRVIEAFLRLTTDYGGQVSTRRGSFAVPPEFENVFALLDRCGYVVHVGDEVKWTERTVPQMRAIHAWQEETAAEGEPDEADTGMD